MTWRQYAGNFDNPINPEYEQEARLVDQSRAGSERAFSALLARYQQPVFRLIFYLVGDDEEARDLTRIAIKNALLHMPSVPAGFSIRPWLLRVAVLVALDAVRERSETPQQLLASLQLPAPAAAPRIVDADPAESDTMELGVTRMETLAHRPETAIADAWDTLPVDVERELIRRLLSGLPEGDAELLALGAVGQVPTRDLAALAGTSQRSIRRRVARALILFQSRYYSVRHDALPPAPEEKTLPPAEVATTPLELARRGINEASDRVIRTLQGVRAGFGSTEAQERLQTLRATDIPPAEVQSAETPRRSVPLTAPSAPSVVDADPTMPLPRAMHDATDDEAFADWTTPVPSMDVPDLATSKTPSIANADQVTELLPRSAHGPPPPNIIPMPPASTPYRAADPAAAMTIPTPAPTEAITTPASPNLAAVTEPLPALSADATTLVRSAPETAPSTAADVAPPADTHSVAGADVTVAATQIPEAPTLVRTDPATTADAATTQRRLPRFGPPPEEVIVGNPHESAAALDMAEEPTDATEAPILAEEPTDTLILAEAPADSLEPPLADEALPIDAEDMPYDEAEAPLNSEALVAMPVAALDEADEAVATVPLPADEEPVALDANIPAAAPSEVPLDDVDAALTPLMPASDAETADEVSAAIDEAPAALVVSDDPALTAMPDTESAQPLVDDVADEPLVDVADQADGTIVAAPADTETAEEATIGATSVADDFATDQADDLPLIEEDTEAAATGDVSDADEPAAEQDTNDALLLEAETALPMEATAPDLDEAEAPEEATEQEAQATPQDLEADSEADEEEEPPPVPSVAAIERSGTEEAPARSGTLNSTVVLQPLARADYVNRHRPPWLDVADLGSLPGVALDPDAERDAPPSNGEPSVPLMGALHVAAHDVLPEQIGDIPTTPPEQGMDLADLADLAVPTPLMNPDEATDIETPRAPRPPTRPLPKLDRDMIDPPRER